jgi:hypothetical protein
LRAGDCEPRTVVVAGAGAAGLVPAWLQAQAAPAAISAHFCA